MPRHWRVVRVAGAVRGAGRGDRGDGVRVAAVVFGTRMVWDLLSWLWPDAQFHSPGPRRLVCLLASPPARMVAGRADPLANPLPNSRPVPASKTFDSSSTENLDRALSH